MRRTHIGTLTTSALLAVATVAAGDVNRSAMSSNYAAYQKQHAAKSGLLGAATSLTGALGLGGLTAPVTSTLDRIYRYQIRLTTGGIDPTNTPMFGSDLGNSRQKLDMQIGITAAHAQATGRDIVVAVLDGGFNLDHPAIAKRVLPYQFDAVQGDWSAQDRGNGRDDDQDGIVDNGVGHGTFVSGMILLVAPDAWILPVKIADDEGYGLESEVVSGIDFAESMGADVINISFELGSLSANIRSKLDEAASKEIVVVVAAGNDGATQTKTMAQDPNTVSVGAVDSTDAVARWSNTPTDGKGLSLFAPGVALYGPHGGPTNDAMCTWSGTSFSSPLAAGAAALLLERHPKFTPQQVSACLRAASAAPVKAWDGSTYAFTGRIDLRRVVTQ